jgi:hypothetical protein
MKKRLTALLITLTTVMSLTACSGGSSTSSAVNSTSGSTSSDIAYSTNDSYGFSSEYKGSSDDYEETVETDNYNEVDKEDIESENIDNTTNNSSNSNIVLVEDKLVYKCYVDIETLDFDKSYAALQDMMEKYNCVISSETFGDESISYFYDSYYSSSSKYKTGRTDEIVIRVPSANYKRFISEYGELGNVTSKTQTVDNITQEYYDTTSQVDGLKAEMERLEIMMSQATEIEDMITINQAITELQSEINSLTTYIRTMDSDVAYSYVTMSLREVLEYSEVEQPVKKNTFIDRLKNQCVDTWKGFLNFLENLLFTIISLIPAIVIIGIIVIIIKLTCRNKIKTWKENRKLRRTSGDGSINELNTLLKYDENKVNSGVDTDEPKDKQ